VLLSYALLSNTTGVPTALPTSSSFEYQCTVLLFLFISFIVDVVIVALLKAVLTVAAA
jgi:hypothetical protein